MTTACKPRPRRAGAVITGRRTGEFADYWGGDHHDGVPIFVPTHTAPTDNRHERVHFVTEGIAACAEQAKRPQAIEMSCCTAPTQPRSA